MKTFFRLSLLALITLTLTNCGKVEKSNHPSSQNPEITAPEFADNSQALEFYKEHFCTVK